MYVKTHSFLVLFLAVMADAQNYKVQVDLIQMYVAQRHIKFATLILCWEIKDVKSLNIILNERNVKTRTVGVQKRVTIFKSVLHVTIADFNCVGTLELFKKVAQEDSLDPSNKWLIFTENFSNVKENLRNSKLRLDSDILIVDKFAKAFRLYDIYNPGYNLGGRLHVVTLGTWRPSKSISFVSKYESRRRLALNLRAATVITNAALSPRDYLRDINKNHLDNVHKFNYGLLMYIQEMHGFNASLRVTSKFYEERSGGLTGGIAGLLNGGEADFAATSIYLTPKIVKNFDIMVNTYMYRTCFLFRNPGNFKDHNEFVEPMAKEVWLATLYCTMLVMILLRVVFFGDEIIYEKVEDDYIKMNYVEGKDWSAIICDTLSILIQQGSTYEPNCVSGKIILFSYLALGVLLFNYYTSIMVANLLGFPPPPFKNLLELHRSEIPMGIEDSSYTMSILENYKIKHQNMTKHETLPTKTYNLITGIEKMKNQTFALFAHADSAYSLIKDTFTLNAICDVNEISIAKPTDMYVISRKNSEYTKMLTIRRLFESGLSQHVSYKRLLNGLPCLANRDVLPVGLDRCKGVYITFVVGCILSIIFMTLERYRYKSQHRIDWLKKRTIMKICKK